jgi:hypothetical protein
VDIILRAYKAGAPEHLVRDALMEFANVGVAWTAAAVGTLCFQGATSDRDMAKQLCRVLQLPNNHPLQLVFKNMLEELMKYIPDDFQSALLMD